MSLCVNSSSYFISHCIIARDQDLKPSQPWSTLHSALSDLNWDKTHAELLPNTLKHANAYYHLCSTWSEIQMMNNTMHCLPHISSLLLLRRTSWFCKETDNHILQANIYCKLQRRTGPWWCEVIIMMMMIISNHLSNVTWSWGVSV